MTNLYRYDQNNSGGHFDIDSEKGIGTIVYIEAKDAYHADERAESIGIYFNGCEDGKDCDCCGDRWWPANETNIATDENRKYDKKSQHGYIHYLDGRIERIK